MKLHKNENPLILKNSIFKEIVDHNRLHFIHKTKKN